MKLIRNAVRCKRCGDIIESKSVHHLTYCSCKSVGIDGGLEYTRVLFMDEDDFENLYEWATLDTEHTSIKKLPENNDCKDEIE